MGLVHRVVGVDTLEEDVMSYAKGIATLSPESLRVTKSMIAAYRKGQRTDTPDTDAQFAAEGQRTDTPETDAQFAAGFASKDFGEGFRAFLEKRKPDFR